jgi:alkanesulfonate monooxygenase SsuD/methylene tetrahydromethanopterin reductase-like flavin-dependent oxidoreductase (luciferase family)
MRIGTGLPNQVRDMRPAVIPAWARQAENAGFTSLATVGRYAYPGVSDTVALAAAAAVTSRIDLVSAILLGPTWPGTMLAKELAGIDGVSNGRLTVGLGVGNRPDDFVVEGYGAAGRGKRFDQDLALCGAITRPWHLTWPSILGTRVPTPPVPADGPVVRLVDAPHAKRRLQGGGDLGLAA